MTDEKEVFELIKIGKFENIPSECWKDRDVVLKAIEVSADGLKFADEKFHFDREIVLKAVKHHGASLGYVLNKDFLNDQEIALEAVKSFDYGVLNYVSEKLLSNKEFVIKIIKENGGAIEYVSDSLKNDPDILAIVNKDK